MGDNYSSTDLILGYYEYTIVIITEDGSIAKSKNRGVIGYFKSIDEFNEYVSNLKKSSVTRIDDRTSIISYSYNYVVIHEGIKDGWVPPLNNSVVLLNPQNDYYTDVISDKCRSIAQNSYKNYKSLDD